METKIKALIFLTIIVILCLIVIRFKINIDKKRKSLEIQSVDPHIVTIKPKEKRSFLSTTPSAVLAILTFFGAMILLFGIGEGLGREGLGILNDSIAEVSAYSISALLISTSCFFIVKENPSSIWYVPVICNFLGILSAISEPGFWLTTSWWVIVCGGWLLSIVFSIIGALKGRRIVI
jgi:hypothetical protein